VYISRGRRPRGRVHGGAEKARLEVLPLHKQRDGVLRACGDVWVGDLAEARERRELLRP
jgi:hypothetical protein